MFKTLISKSILPVLAAALLAAAPASAATFTFMSEVTTSIGPSMTPGTPSLPPPGTLGTVELEINDSDPSLTIFDGFDVRVFATASVDVPGWISGSMVNNPNPFDFFQITAESLAFGSYGPTSVAEDNGAFILPNGRHSFRVNFGTPAAAVPVTIGDLVTALNAPGATGFFSHELEGSPGFIFTRVEFPATEIPLPASAFLLLAGLAGLGTVRARRTKV